MQVWDDTHNTLDNVSQWFCLMLMIWTKPWPLSEQGNLLFPATTTSLSSPILLSLLYLLKRIIARFLMLSFSQFLSCRMFLSFTVRFSCATHDWSSQASGWSFTLEIFVGPRICGAIVDGRESVRAQCNFHSSCWHAGGLLYLSRSVLCMRHSNLPTLRTVMVIADLFSVTNQGV